jgi:hypothetical protein
VTICDLSDSPAIELYFYDELDAAERTRVQAHVADCPECRRRLDDLHAIRRALAALPRVEAPAAGDWSGFMQRLDRSCGIPAFDASGVAPKPPRARWPLRPALAIAATLMLVTIGAVVATRFRTEAPTSKPATPPVALGTATPVQPTVARTPGRALAELSEQHFERSKLVVLDLASRDPEHTSATDWAYERDLAGSLLSDTRLYRLAAKDRGLQDIARVMGDLETVLLEASMSDDKDPAALERVQKLIRKRDLVVKMQVVGSAGI